MQKQDSSFEERIRSTEENLSGIKHKIAVMSGKGGVGKTTIAVNLAAYLAKEGGVALLDADIDCPNVNRFLGINEKFRVKGDSIIPAEKFGIKVVSFASLQEREDQPIIWRGPMLSNAIMQIMEQADWGKLGYLIVDLPPGTSDAPLTVMQMLKPDGMVIVTTPQGVAVTDAKKSANMAKELGVPVLGIVENMAGNVFGSGGGENAAKDLGVKFFGRLALDAAVAGSAENGKPFILESGEHANEFKRIAENIKRGLI